MDGQDHFKTFVAEQDHAANVKKIEKMLKTHSNIEKSGWFKSSVSTLQGVTTVILSILSSSLVYKKKRNMRSQFFGRTNMVGSAV